MIRLQRPPCPEVLEKHREEWTRRYLERRAKSPGKRPESHEYGHPRVKAVLVAMSHGKCFYCEQRLSEKEQTVDHYVEISEDPSKAFEWENLYLCCDGCQDKLEESTVPRASCIDPCGAVDPSAHLTFQKDEILPRGSSTAGRQTIRKYQLNRGDLALRRSRHLNEFREVLDEIRQKQIAEGRRGLTELEKELLLRFVQPEAPFSLMFFDLLRNAGLISTAAKATAPAGQTSP